MNKKILIIDDSPDDIRAIESSIIEYLSSVNYLSYEIFSQTTIHPLSCLDPTLIFLDLEFSASGQNSLAYLQKFPKDIPIVIVSHLLHYQKLSMLSSNRIVGFLNKSQISSQLPIIMASVFFNQSPVPVNELFSFPGLHSTPSISLVTSEIRYFFFHSPSTYQIHFITGKSIEIHSVPFHKICSLMKKSHIKNLIQISQNEFINYTQIKSVQRTRSGRLEIHLFNLDYKPFIVSPKFEKELFKILSI